MVANMKKCDLQQQKLLNNNMSEIACRHGQTAHPEDVVKGARDAPEVVRFPHGLRAAFTSR
jgi:hypothetical protein